MGRGGAKHSKNSCAGSIYTYHERNKEKSSQGYGTTKQRLGADSFKDWDCCSLTLQPCKEPVVTPQGVLYEKEAVYTFILKEKQRIASEMRKWETMQAEKPMKEAMKRKAEEEEKARKFLEDECGALPPKRAKVEEVKESVAFDTMKDKEVKGVRAFGSALGHKSLLEGERLSERAKDSCFWIPEATPETKSVEQQKPDDKVKCPISGHPLKLKDLVHVKFTPLDANGTFAMSSSHNDRYICPISKKTLSNAVPCVVLRNSGHCIAKDVYETVIKKDMIDPFGSSRLTAKDIIFLQRGGSGFAASGVNLEASKYNPAMRAF